MKAHTEQTKLALMLFANTQIALELQDRLEGTLMYNKKHRNILARVQEKNEFTINKLYKELDDDTQKIINEMVKASEVVLDAMTTSSLTLFTGLMEELKKGNIKIQEDEKLR